MYPSLILQPFHSSTRDILRCFLEGKPISNEQINFLDWYRRQLSSAEFDPILQYFLAAIKKHHIKTSFLLPHEEINLENIQLLKKRILLLLNQAKRVAIQITQKQFFDLQKLLVNELIFWHGNQFLTGAPFFPGGIPPVIFFQWGNLFGIVKYVVIAGEKALHANLLVYFENMQEKKLDQCVHEYQQEIEKELQGQKEIFVEHELETPRLDKFLIKPLPPFVKFHT